LSPKQRGEHEKLGKGAGRIVKYQRVSRDTQALAERVLGEKGIRGVGSLYRQKRAGI